MLVSGVLEKIEDIYGSTQIEFILRTKLSVILSVMLLMVGV